MEILKKKKRILILKQSMFTFTLRASISDWRRKRIRKN